MDEKPYQDKNWLIQKYDEEKLSSVQIARKCNVSKTTIWKWLKRFDIKLRTQSEIMKGKIPFFTGQKHSEESKKKMSESHRGITPWNKDKPFLAISGDKHYRWGKHCSDEIKSKISRTKMGRYLRENNPNWKGGRIDFQGYCYIYMPNHPNCKRMYVAEHRLVMEKHLGRYLKPNECVHHKDGNKKNNKLQNLELTTKRRHKKNNYQVFQYGYKKGFTEAFLLFLYVSKFKEKGENK